MSRSKPWVHSIPDKIHARQLQALQARVYVLQESGPTAFVVKEQDSPKKHRVTLGDPSTCNCSVFSKERDLCIHILWVLLKLFRIPPENPLTWQGSLVEREIQEIIRSRERLRARVAAPSNQEPANQTLPKGEVEQRVVGDGDCCPICQDDMVPSQNLTYCRYGCGHSVHSRCMKIWADHQLSQGTKILCPMCRTEFGTLKMIMTDHLKQKPQQANTHPGTACRGCQTAPLRGKIYLCTVCDKYVLCMTCFSNNTHPQHTFQFKEKPTQRWRPALRNFTSSLTPQEVSDLQGRELNQNDYDMLLQLDNNANGGRVGCLSEKEIAALKTIMLTKTSSLLSRRSNVECPVCLAGYGISQHVVELPCSHKLHKICAENWFTHLHDYCPVCNETVVVTLPQRRPSQVKKNNVNKEPELLREEKFVDLSLSGSGIQTSSVPPRSVSSSSSRGESTTSSTTTLRNTPNSNNINMPSNNTMLSSGRDLIVGRSNANNSITIKSSVKSRVVPRTKPPRPRHQEKQGEVMLFVGNEGGGGESPQDIIKQVSSVHETNVRRGRRLSKSGRRSRSQSRERVVEFDITGIGL